MRKAKDMKIAIIGLGKMGEALARGWAKHQLVGTTRTSESAADAAKRLGIKVSTDSVAAVRGAQVVLLSVKPHQCEALLKKLAPKLTRDHLLVSIVASVTNEQLAKWSGGNASIIRAMPNTPCVIGEGMTVFAPGPGAETAEIKMAESLFSAVGRTAVVEESLMDGVTGLSGCGPAYIYMVIEALSEAGVMVGLPRKTATLLAAQTLSGAAQMVLQRGDHPAALKDEVTTPAGCTIDGLMALEEGKLRATLIHAVLAATRRSASLRSGK